MSVHGHWPTSILASILVGGCMGRAVQQPARPRVLTGLECSDLVQHYCGDQYDEDQCYRALIWTGASYDQKGEFVKAYRAYQLAEAARPGDRAAAVRKEYARRAGAKAQQTRLDHSARPAALRVVVTFNGPRESLDLLEILLDFEPIVWRQGEPLDAREVTILPGTHEVNVTAGIRQSPRRTLSRRTDRFASNTERLTLRIVVDALGQEIRIEVITEPRGVPDHLPTDATGIGASFEPPCSPDRPTGSSPIA